VTIPQMAAMSFLLIIMLAVASTFDRSTAPTGPPHHNDVVVDHDEGITSSA
jgi:hypothetical protein